MAVNILSLGAGIQSSTLLLMVCKGILPPIEAAIFADTQWEPQYVYDQLEFLKGVASSAGVRVLVVTVGSLRSEALSFFSDRHQQARWASLPVFVKNLDGTVGRMNRQCTKEYKIEAIEKAIRQDIFGLKPYGRIPTKVNQWIGISRDEMGRVRLARKSWMVNQYPLINFPERFTGKDYTRDECEQWLKDNYPGRVWTESSCAGCPNRDDDQWLNLKLNHPDTFEDACQFDEMMRATEAARLEAQGRICGTVYLHRSCVPLREVDFIERLEEKRNKQKLVQLEKLGQRNWVNECEGHCGI